MTGKKCMKCGGELSYDEIALHRKMINRGAVEFLCLTCISEHFKIDEAALKDKIEYFKRTGCTLFFL